MKLNELRNGIFSIGLALVADQERGGFAMPSVTGRNPVQSFRNSIDNFDAIAKRLRNVCVENLDYKDCIERYDSDSSLFYVDCPYYGHEHYYGDTFTEQDHYQLSEILHSIKGKAMVSHYAKTFTIGCIKTGIGLSFSHSRGGIRRKRVQKSQRPQKSYIAISDHRKQGVYLVIDFREFLIFLLWFDLIRLVCFGLYWTLP